VRTRCSRVERGFAAPDVESATDGIVGQIEDDTLVLKAQRAEIQQQAAIAASDAEIVNQLRHFNRTNCVQRLQFDENFAVTDEINAVAHGQETIAVANRETNFTDKGNSSVLQLDRERFSADGFEESTSKLAMDGHRSANDFVSLRIVKNWCAAHSSLPMHTLHQRLRIVR
jgi:hypothetical protein